ncbi:extensin family protein [Erythrobacter litoralis]|uniref:extensin family protein n=1 Tax=Erythrobacter litoralis TaxID=39960 RepID=UPI0024353E72|nr:extensin family protein [Erythrobacter litoralis]MDG6077585.1 extensin family protein [Erythrobacter litoralis]
MLSLAGCGIAASDRSAAHPADVGRPSQSQTASPLGQQCLAELGRTNARFTSLPDRDYGGGCSVLNSVQLDRVGSDTGQFAVTNLGPLACPAANALAGWARFAVDRAARQILGSPIARIETMGSYSCRNIAGSTRRSAHARAEAVDIGGFVLGNGRRISVKAGWTGASDEREFLRVVHRSACKRFGTVLGPDYNAAHQDHLHLEAGDGSFCR